MSLFSSLRGARPSPSSSDEKDHDSDREETTTTTMSLSPSHTPLLLDPNNSSGNITNAVDSDSSTFPLRIKLNDGKSTIDFLLDDVLPNVTVRKLKERILSSHFDDSQGPGGALPNSNPSLQSPSRRNNNNNGNNNNNNNRYLRLIVRGRMMAPDTSQLDTFSIAANDVIHAVLAKEGARGGQQARMLKRLNYEGRGTGAAAAVVGGNNGGGSGSSANTGGSPSTRSRESIDQSLWRRIGIDANGVVISSNENENSDDESEEDEGEDFEDAHGEIDLEMGHTQQHGRQQRALDGGEGSGGGSRRRRRRERRGFDRLRATGMTRDEVTAIRIYFSRSVDRYIERRRVMIRASQRLRESLSEIVNTASGGRAGAGVGASSSSPGAGARGGGSSPSSSRQRSNTGESSNSLLEDEGGNSTHVVNSNAEGSTSVNSNVNARRGSVTQEGGNNNATTNDDSNGSSSGGGANSNNNAESSNASSFTGEEILNDRLRMEDEWMSTQGPYSEFRMNLNTSNPLLLAAISGGGNGVGTAAATTPTLPEMGPAGLFFRSRNSTNGMDSGPDDDEDEMFGGAFTPNGTFLRNPNGSTNGGDGYHPYMGPLPSAGTDKDFIWGFILGFFVGFIMLFWVWMPTVPHKQKIGIMTGISFQLGLNLLRKSGEAGVAIGSV